jgi:RNA polymerase sigma factor (sigma-70 family)
MHSTSRTTPSTKPFCKRHKDFLKILDLIPVCTSSSSLSGKKLAGQGQWLVARERSGGGVCGAGSRLFRRPKRCLLSLMTPQLTLKSVPARSRFQRTLWSDVRRAGRSDSTRGVEALDKLCRAYWPPIKAYLRTWGKDEHEAEDLTQGFFAFLLEKQLIACADPDKGRFRSFLLGSLKNFLRNEHERQQALKRGGGTFCVSLEAQREQGHVAEEPVDPRKPDLAFDRGWAMEVLRQASIRLREEYDRAGLKQMFVVLSPYLTSFHHVPYRELAAALGKTEGAVRTALSRLRAYYREIVRGLVAQTVSDPKDVNEEVRYLIAVLREN